MDRSRCRASCFATCVAAAACVVVGLTPAARGQSTYYWTGATGTYSTAGAGTWNSGNTWRLSSSSTGALSTYANGTNAVYFGGAGGTISIASGTVQVNTINVDAAATGTYTIGSGTLQFVGAGSAITVPTGKTFVFGASAGRVLAGGSANTLSISGGGTVEFGQTNHAYGGLVAGNTTIQVSGAGSTVRFIGTNGIRWGSGTSTAITVWNGGAAEFNNTNNYDLALTMGLSGSGGGTVKLASNSGLVTQAGFSLAVSGTGKSTIQSTLSNTSGTASANYGAINGNGGTNGTFTVNATGDASGVDLEYSAAFRNGTLTKSGAGTMRLNAGFMVTQTGSSDLSTFVNTGTSLRVNAGTFLNEGNVYSIANVNGGLLKTTSTSGTFDQVNVTSGTFEISRSSGLFRTLSGTTYAAGNNALNLRGGTIRYVGVNTDYSGQMGGLGGVASSVDTNGESVTFASALTGTGGLRKAGAGTLTLTGTNTFSGAVTVAAGTLQLGTGGNPQTGYLGSVSSITVSTGATLDLQGDNAISGSGGTARDVTINGGVVQANNGNASIGALTLNSGTLASGASPSAFRGSWNLKGDVSVTNDSTISALRVNTAGANRTFTVSAGKTLTVAGSIDDGSNTGTSTNLPSSFTKAGSGTMLLSGSNPYTGGTTLSAGVLAFGDPNSLGTGTATFSGPATLQAAIDATLATPISIDTGVTASFDTQSFVNTLSGTVSGPGAFAKTGSGTLTLAVANSHSGGTVVNEGVLRLGDAGGAGAATGGLTVNAGTFDLAGFSPTFGTISGSSAGTIMSAAAATLTGSSAANSTYAGTITGPVALVKQGSGTLALTNAANSFSGGSTISAGALAFAAGGLGSGTVTMNGGALRWADGNTQDVSGQIALVDATAATLDVGANDVTLAGVIGAGSTGSIVKAGAGTLTLSGSNGYSGGTTVATGTLAFADGGLGSGTVALAANAVLRWADGNTQDVSTQLALPASGAGVLDTNGNAVTLAGAFASGTAGSLAKAGAGTLTLTGTAGYGGTTTISGGTLALAGAGSIASSGIVSIGGSGTLDVSAAGDVVNVGALDGAGAVALGSGTLRSLATTSSTFDGVIGGSGGFTKAGAGTLTLTGSQTLTGRVVVESGTLSLYTLVDGGDKLLQAAIAIVAGPTAASPATLDVSTAGLTIANGQTLGGHGTVLGNVMFDPGAIVAPGGSVGTLAIAGGVAWSGSSGFVLDMADMVSGSAGTGWDLLTVSSLTIDATTASPYVISLTSLANPGDDTPGTMSGSEWNPNASNAWLFVDAGSPITLPEGLWYTFDYANFQNLRPGSFSVVRGGGPGIAGSDDSQLYLVYTAAVPEPGAFALAALGLGALAVRRARRRGR